MINRAERRRRVEALKKGEQTVSEMKVPVDVNNIPPGGIQIGDKVLTQQEVMAIVNAAQEQKLSDELADKVIQAWKTGSGIALNMNLILGPDDVKQICQPDHPAVPQLIARTITEDARLKGHQGLTAIIDKVAMKLVAQPAEAAAVPAEVMAAAAAIIAGNANVIDGATAQVTGALDVTHGEVDPNDAGQIS